MTTEPRTFISPNFGPEKLDSPSTDDLIDVFEDRLRYWLLNPIEKLVDDAQAQIASFALMMSYFEGIWIYMQGGDSRGRSREFFRGGFVDVFQGRNVSERLLGRIADVLYEDARCGFFHEASFRIRVYFSAHFGGPIAATLPKIGGVIDESGTIESLVVHPRECFAFLCGHFERYLEALRDPSNVDLRRRFEDACRIKWKLGETPPVVAL